MEDKPTQPLVVDLDGTLLRTDLLHESIVLLLFRHPLQALRLPFWLLRGRAYFKHRLASLVAPAFANLPVNEQCLELIEEAAAQGRKVVLATASPIDQARAISARFPALSEVIGSSREHNLKGDRKAAELVARYGVGGYDYVGDSNADLPVWAQARQAFAVNPRRRTRHNFLSLHPEGKILQDANKSIMNKYLKTLRPHQWAKNLLLFVPLLTAHKLDDAHALTSVLMAFAAFSLAASAIYIINDLIDLEHDRQHPDKCKRPLASGDVPLLHGLAMVPCLLAVALILALNLPAAFLAVLAGYLLATTAYSLWLKKQLLIDVFTLAGLYTLRIFAGATTIQVAVSPWLLLLSIFIFFSLALIKRYAELKVLASDNHQQVAGRGYSVDDMPLLSVLGVSSGLMSVLVLALYIQSEQVHNLYSTPELLWGSCILIMYWITRVWMLANHGKMLEDPILFALRDVNSLLTAALLGLLFLVAI